MPRVTVTRNKQTNAKTLNTHFSKEIYSLLHLARVHREDKYLWQPIKKKIYIYIVFVSFSFPFLILFLFSLFICAQIEYKFLKKCC